MTNGMLASPTAIKTKANANIAHHAAIHCSIPTITSPEPKEHPRRREFDDATGRD